MKAIILAAGEGKRMGSLTDKIPKCLLSYKGESILERLIWQIKKYGVDEIFVVVGYQKRLLSNILKNIKGVKTVVNESYKTDTNIRSMFLAMAASGIDDDIVVFESDIVAEDEFIRYVTGTDFEGKSVWFTKGKFQPGQKGGVLKVDKYGAVVDVKVAEYNDKYRDYEKLTGVMRIAKKQLKAYCHILELEMKTDQYYFVPWVNNIKGLYSIKGDARFFSLASFNTVEEYKDLKSIDFDYPIGTREICFKKIKYLLPIEDYDALRLPVVKKGVINNGFWVTPLKIEKNHNLVLDGHHSLKLAKQMGLTYVPVIGFDYSEVDVWSLRENITVTKDKVIKTIKRGGLYPYKTVKHRFPSVLCKCSIEVEKLKEMS